MRPLIIDCMTDIHHDRKGKEGFGEAVFGKQHEASR
jgi:hypothetical protein